MARIVTSDDDCDVIRADGWKSGKWEFWCVRCVDERTSSLFSSQPTRRLGEFEFIWYNVDIYEMES